MIPALTAVATTAIGQVPAAWSRAVPNPYRLLLATPDAGLVYLMVAQPRDPVRVRPLAGCPLMPGGGAVAASVPIPGVAVSVYLASRSYMTAPDETPANTLFDGALDQPHSVEMRLFSGAAPLSDAETAWGSIVALDEAGELDALTAYDWHGAPIDVLVGTQSFPLAQFVPAIRAEGAGLDWSTGQMVIHLGSRLSVLQRLVVRRIYKGTGGIEGGSDLAGRPTPLAYGRVRHVPLVPVDRVQQLYQAHDGQIGAVDAVYDKALPLTAGADYPTAAALLAAAPAAGTYATCLAEGYVRLGSPAVGVVTADLHGDAVGGYVETAAAIVRRLCFTRLGDRCLTDDQVMPGDVARMDILRGWPVGLYAVADITVDALVVEALSSVGAKRVASRDGRLRLVPLALATTPKATLASGDVDEAGIAVAATSAPVWRVKVGWGRLWQVFADNDIGGRIADPAERERLTQEYRYATATSERVRFRSGAAGELTVVTNLTDEAAAAELAETLLAVCGQGGARYTVPIRQHPFLYDLGDAVVVNTARSWRGAGRPLLVAGIQEDAKTGGNVLELYG